MVVVDLGAPEADAYAGKPTVTLLDGRVVSTWSPEWLEETRARHATALEILALDTKQQRLARLDKIETDQGLLARQRMEAEVMAVWRARQAKWEQQA